MMQPRPTPRCDSTLLQLFWWEFQHPKHLLLGLCGTIRTPSLWVLILFPRKCTFFPLGIILFSKGVIPSKGMPTIFYVTWKRILYHLQNSQPNWGGVTLISFMRFDEIEHYNQAKTSLFMAHLEEMAVMKSLLYVKHIGQGNTFKFENVYLRDICLHHQTACIKLSQYCTCS